MTERLSPSSRLTMQEAQGQTADTVTKALLRAPSLVSELTGHLASAQGKGVRSQLLFYAAADAEGAVPRDTVCAAAAVELFHLATLVHDDVIDDAPLRRGIPTLQHKFGKKQAVICGDYLLCLAASLIAPLHADYQEYAGLLTIFTSALSRTCMGELGQFRNNRNVGLGVPGYLRIIAGKTASLFYVSALAGALIARYNRDDAMRLARFGRYLGMIFQIVDDCKDYEFSEDKALKTVGKDIAEGVITLPLIYAIGAEPQLRGLAKDAFDDAAMAKQLVRAVRDAGGTRRSSELAARYAAKAESLLKTFPEAKIRPLFELMQKSIRATDVF